MEILTKSNGNIEIRKAYQGLTIVTNEGRRLNIILRDFGWEMNIEEPDGKGDEKVIWHVVNNDDDFKPIEKKELDVENVTGGLPSLETWK